MTRGRKIEVLRKRRDWLNERIAANPGMHLSFDRAEAAALTWAIEELEKRTAPEHPLATGDLDVELQALGIDPLGNAS